MAGGFGSNNVSCPQRQVSFLSLRKMGAGTPVLEGLCAKFCSVVDNGAGDYEITVNKQAPFAQIVQAFVQLHEPGFASIEVANTDKLKVTILVVDTDGTTPLDANFDLLVVGSNATDLIG